MLNTVYCLKTLKNNLFQAKNFGSALTLIQYKTVNKTHKGLDKYENKLYFRKKKLREDLAIGEKVLLLAERIKNKSAPGKSYKSSVQNISFFNKSNKIQ